MDIFKKITMITAAAALCSFSIHLCTYAADEPCYTVTAPQSEENGVLTLADGQKWYRVNSFEDENDYIISVMDSDGSKKIFTAEDSRSSEYIWHYFRRTMVTSVAPEYTSLSSSSFRLTYHEGQLYTSSNWWTDGDSVWDYSGGTLSYNENGSIHYLKYDEDSHEPFSCTDNAAEAAQVCIYARGEQLSRCIGKQPAADSYVIEGSGYAAPRFSVELSDKNIITDSVKWFVDGEEQDCAGLAFTADSLRGKPVGVHHVGCLVEGHDADGVHYRERSAEAAFVIAKGVLPDSFMSFSDIHEQYEFIDKAIEKIMESTDGYIPSLVVCTGDLVNGPTADKDRMLSRYYPQIVSHLGGLDAVFVSGNHDSGEAASIMSVRAGLGADKDNGFGGGQIFRGISEGVRENGRNSRFAKGITVYGMNFENALYQSGGEFAYSYDRTLKDLDSFLKKTAESYNGELVVISAHSGLHVLGLQPESVNANGRSIGKWIGENQYNVDYSYELARLINSYAEKYHMDIMYLFGHDHSRGETEFILSDGDTLISTEKYGDMSYDSQKLSFTYGHAGFLSTTIGSANARFSFIYRDGEHYSYNIMNLDGDTVLHRDITAKSTFREPAVTTASSAVTTTALTSKAKMSADSPKTGDRTSAVIAFIPAAVLVLLVTMKKKER
ncbi:metallophosphoesterase [Ruminococcus sp.]|uniref:metallophosphoesterase n=1 Tax=Ruminococcus sp. TaxID=41978 RepID=UPI0025E69B9E|nr:metallophosphoesterase [Ruminococcus sp.]MCR4638135.1 metallophosphoesterase [Ruminococcus sp.]